MPSALASAHTSIRVAHDLEESTGPLLHRHNPDDLEQTLIYESIDKSLAKSNSNAATVPPMANNIANAGDTATTNNRANEHNVPNVHDGFITTVNVNDVKTGVPVGGNNKELLIPKDISIYSSANNVNGATIAAVFTATGTSINAKDDSNTEERPLPQPNRNISAIRRRRRHRRDSATTTTPANCVPECETYDVEQHLFHHHHRQNHHRNGQNASVPPTVHGNDSTVEATDVGGIIGSTVANGDTRLSKQQQQQQQQLPHQQSVPLPPDTSSGEQILYFESSSSSRLMGNAGGNRTINATNETDNKQNVPVVDGDRIIIITDDTMDVSVDEEGGGTVAEPVKGDDLYVNDEAPKTLPLRPIIRGPYNDDGEIDDDDSNSDTTTVYTEQHAEVKLNCEVDLDISAVVWMRNGQVSD